ncbi:hypothetical protein K0M31_013530 [Melipona bicolor]|uniref:Uncharacterized protein n=1 Tax=Melipona bicolor TaxID=60889 RepID=A0AA40KGC5_9HYME|nr:hypothetical protein K0M31_013530 [Melipona bicolor]
MICVSIRRPCNYFYCLFVLSRELSRRHNQAAHAGGLIRRGPPSNKLRITDCVDALESVLSHPDSHYVLSPQGLGKCLLSYGVIVRPMRGF